MKKIIAIAALVVASSASASNFDFWNSDNKFVAVDRHGYPVRDNGIFAFNGYELTNPKWYAQEFINMVDEIDNEIDNETYRKFTSASYNYVAPTFPALEK